ncbi:unnamed protein product, partial [Ectocarpus sp. 6 AP-2014]
QFSVLFYFIQYAYYTRYDLGRRSFILFAVPAGEGEKVKPSSVFACGNERMYLFFCRFVVLYWAGQCFGVQLYVADIGHSACMLRSVGFRWLLLVCVLKLT